MNNIVSSCAEKDFRGSIKVSDDEDKVRIGNKSKSCGILQRLHVSALQSRHNMVEVDSCLEAGQRIFGGGLETERNI